MKANHTPGPWRVWHHDMQSGGPAITNRDGLVSIARANYLVRGQRGLIEQTVANANLIAAAPELLAALMQIVADWDNVDPNVQVPDEINVDDHWEAARDAIVKALGGA